MRLSLVEAKGVAKFSARFDESKRTESCGRITENIFR